MQPPSDIIETLKSGSLFSDILEEHWRQQLLSYKIVSFWEGIGDVRALIILYDMLNSMITWSNLGCTKKECRVRASW